MTILAGDIKLVASQVMADVPEGGGGPTANVIADGVSNAIFPDISELDRAGGRVNMRKVFTTVETANVDTYLGSNIIVAVPPQDPNVSITLFSTESTFDERAAAQSRLESYLFQGANYSGYLFGNHISGQRALTVWQKSDGTPGVGDTLVLLKREGFSDQAEQYVRVTSASSVLTTFTDAQGDFQRYVLTINISDPLRMDFPGLDVTRFDPTSDQIAAKTKIAETVVADAAQYYGCVPLTEAVDIGDYSAKASSIYTRLLPSAQVETPIADARTNQLYGGLIATGGTISGNLTGLFTTTQNLYIGGGVLPGSFSISRGGVTLTDNGGALVDATTAEKGRIDYENGVLTLSENVFGTSGGTHAVSYTPASAPTAVTQSVGVPITSSNRSLSYVFTVQPVPARGSMIVNFRAGGRWYVLRDTGAGVILGAESGYGAGTLNFTTGTLSVTLGALPDVGSSIIYQWVDGSASTSTNSGITNSAKIYIPINSDGQCSVEPGSKSFTPSGVSLTWTGPGGSKTATDDGVGNLTGDATGTVDYGRGIIKVSPAALPTVGGTATLNITEKVTSGAVGAFTSVDASYWGATTSANVNPRSFNLFVNVQVYSAYDASGNPWTLGGTVQTVQERIYDDGAGNLKLNGHLTSVTVGTINYTTGAITVLKTINVAYGHTAYVYSSGMAVPQWSTDAIPLVPTSVVSAQYTATTTTASNTHTVTIDKVVAEVQIGNQQSIGGVQFKVGAKEYWLKSGNVIQTDLSPVTGVGTEVGTLSGNRVTLTNWVSGSAPAITDFRSVQALPVNGPYTPYNAIGLTFRTATSPLRPSSVSVVGTMMDGTTFNVAADADGKINGTRVKGRVNYEFGVVELYFVQASGSITADLSFLGIAGVGTVYSSMARLETLRYNAVAYTYLPLDADLIGVDPVRLPSDGRVPIFRAGGFAVIGNTQSTTATVSNGQTINAGRVRLSRFRVIGANGAVINTGYTQDLEAGTLTFTNVSGYSQPVTIENRIEDMLTIRDAQINGQLEFTRQITHNYPTTGSYISSALVAGDVFARVSKVFDQGSWDGVTWSDELQGSAATATYNTALSPLAVTNEGALTERWIIQFTSTTAFRVIGEHVGVIATGSINADCSPINPNTSSPYFTIPALGWGTGWAVGNILRINTVGAEFPVWVVRTIQQGPETVTNDSFTLLARGDVDTP